jgi:hypothetical protein
VNDEEGNLLADSHNILKYGKNNSVSYWEYLGSVILVPDPTHFKLKTAIANLKKYKFQVVIKFQQNWFKQEVLQYDLRAITY